MKNPFKKFKKTTVLDGLKEDIERIRERMIEADEEGTDDYYEYFDEYLKLIDRYEEIEKNKSHPFIEYTLKALGIGVPVGVTIWGTKKTMEYEKEDIMSSTAGKQFFKKLFHM